ncbi:MAG: hypothetical protein GF317_11755, partial [Candidatus Lokiarchaeota archaeon]|nr:hypothetical protein [Candidatus Lokiarchaeota archaeon]MBD3200320.1 hypothetical protein [Candidatus Lokiarchaeota archaeon]
MKRKIFITIFAVIFVLFFGSLLTGVNSYSPENTYTDPGADSTPDTDILTVSIDNTNSFLRFKVELNDSWIFASFFRIYAFISVDPLTGTDWGGFIDFNSDYIIDFNPSSTEDRVDFDDYSDNNNDLNEGEEFGMAFSSLTNDNKTIEFSWKLKSQYNGTG